MWIRVFFQVGTMPSRLFFEKQHATSVGGYFEPFFPFEIQPVASNFFSGHAGFEQLDPCPGYRAETRRADEYPSRRGLASFDCLEQFPCAHAVEFSEKREVKVAGALAPSDAKSRVHLRPPVIFPICSMSSSSVSPSFDSAMDLDGQQPQPPPQPQEGASFLSARANRVQRYQAATATMRITITLSMQILSFYILFVFRFDG
jgi:hypothetical protein